MKRLKSLSIISILLCLTSCPAEQSNTSSTNTQIPIDLTFDIQKENTTINEVTLTVGDTLSLQTKNNYDLNVDITWTSASNEIATIDENGLLTAISKGTTIITATVTDAPYITQSIYATIKNPIIQEGVGDGSSALNPVFIGNEGEDEPIEVYFIEMQHIYADSLFIKKGNIDILIDSGYGYDGPFVNQFLTEHMSDNRLDLLMFSHSDGDHIDGSQSALENVENISLMIDYGGVGNGYLTTIRSDYANKGMVYHSAYDSINGINGATSRYYLTEEFYFDVLNTGSYITNTEGSAGNANSVAVIFYYKDFSFFTGGDITTETESKLLKNEDLPEVTLYKASHHGSHGSNSQNFLNTLNPKGVAISAARANRWNATPTGPSKDNTYNLDGFGGHPAGEAIQRIYQIPNISQNLNVFWNAVNGTMKFESYGTDSFTFKGSPTMKGYYDLTLTDGVAVWNEELNDFENKVTGEDNLRLHETKMFQIRNYISYLPEWAQKEYFPN